MLRLSVVFLLLLMLQCSCGEDGLRSARFHNDQEVFLEFIYAGNISDYSINYSMEKARVYATEQLHDEFDTLYTAEFAVVSMTPLSEIVDRAERSGMPTKVIISADVEIADALLEIATQHPGINFVIVHYGAIFGPIPTNVHIVRPKWYYGLYLAGRVCAKAASSDQVGLVIRLPTVVGLRQYANAFFLGVKKERPNARVGIATVDFWNASISANAAAHSLIEWGATCMSAGQGNAVAYQVFRDHGLPSVGLASNVRIFAGDSVWTSFMLDMGPVFYQNLRDIANNNMSLGREISYSMSEIERGDWGLNVERAIRTAVDQQVNETTQPSFCLFSYSAYQTLGLPWPNNTDTDECLDGVPLFNPLKIMQTWSPHIEHVADWTTESATNRVYWRYSSTMAIIVLSVAALFAIFCLYLLPHIVIYRKSRVYAISSWLVIFMIPIACLFHLASIVPYLDRPTAAACNLRLWLESIGTVLLLGALLSRNYKHYIWKRDGLTVLTKEYVSRFTVSAYELFVMWLLPLTLAMLSILVFYTTLTPVEPKFATAPYLPFGSVESACKITRSGVGQIVWITFLMLMAATNLGFLYVLKNIPLLGGEVVASGAIVLNTVVFGGLTAFVATVVGRELVTVSLVIWLKVLVVGVTLIVLVAPKWWAITIQDVKEELDNIDHSNHTDSSSLTSIARRPKEPIPEFYSESSVPSSSSISEEDESGKSNAPPHPPSKSPASDAPSSGIANGKMARPGSGTSTPTTTSSEDESTGPHQTGLGSPPSHLSHALARLKPSSSTSTGNTSKEEDESNSDSTANPNDDRV